MLLGAVIYECCFLECETRWHDIYIWCLYRERTAVAWKYLLERKAINVALFTTQKTLFFFVIGGQSQTKQGWWLRGLFAGSYLFATRFCPTNKSSKDTKPRWCESGRRLKILYSERVEVVTQCTYMNNVIG